MKITYPGFGRVIVEGETFDHDIVVDGQQIWARDKTPSRPLKSRFGHTPLTVEEAIPWSRQRLIVGTGFSGRLPIATDVQREAVARGVELVSLPTAEACDLLRSLDRNDVSAILHVTC